MQHGVQLAQPLATVSQTPFTAPLSSLAPSLRLRKTLQQPAGATLSTLLQLTSSLRQQLAEAAVRSLDEAAGSRREAAEQLPESAPVPAVISLDSPAGRGAQQQGCRAEAAGNGLGLWTHKHRPTSCAQV